MWKIENNKAILNIKKVRSDFRQTSQNGFTLVCPKKNMWDWNESEKWLRSIVINDSGELVSCGWPKFGNYGEFAEDTSILDSYLSKGEVLFTHKHDGSLCIRSVFGGKVVFRTRGTLFGGEYDEEGNEPFGVKFEKVAKKLYPQLLNMEWCANQSLLFEYVAPDNKIVIGYDREDLIFLGYVNHNLSIGLWDDVVNVSKEGGLRLVELHKLPHNPTELLDVIKDWENEGVVVRCNNSQTMVKVKSATYLYKHRLKSNMNYSFIVEFIGLSRITSEEQLVEELSKELDFETVMEGVKLYRIYADALNKYNNFLQYSRTLYADFVSSHSHLAEDKVEMRKQYAVLACQQENIVRAMMFALYDNKTDVLEILKKKMIMNEGKTK